MSVGDMTRIVVCVDDTDDLTKSTSTGAVAESIAEAIVGMGGVIELGITRHQLLLDEKVPYTSHNSSMAIAARLPSECLSNIHAAARSAVRTLMAKSADPGLCIACVPPDEHDGFLYELISFGRAAKERYIPKSEALELAAKIDWLSLEELGGDGQGVVGALAGVGLRLSGNDGRFRGKWNLRAACEGKDPISNKKNARENLGRDQGGGRGRGDGQGGGSGSGKKRDHGKRRSTHSNNAKSPGFADQSIGQVRDVLESLVEGRVLFVDSAGNYLPDAVKIHAAENVKPLFYAGCLTIVAELDKDGIAQPCSKDEFDDASGVFSDMNRDCFAFEFDNDQEEFGAIESVAACPNCLYRRWTAGGFVCMKRQEAPLSLSEMIR